MRRSVRLLIVSLGIAGLGFLAWHFALRPAAAEAAANPDARAPRQFAPADQSRAATLAALRNAPLVPSSTTSHNIGTELPFWANATLLRAARTEALPDGTFRRVTMLQPSDLPYRVRIEDIVRTEPDGTETLLHRSEVVADHVLVHLADGADRDAFAAALSTHGASLGRSIGRRGLQRVQLTNREDLDALPALLDALAASTALRFAEPDYIVRVASTPDDPRYLDGSLWGLHNTGQNGGSADADIDAPEGWAVRHQAPTVVVGVVDTGIRLTHQDLAPNLWVNPNEIANGVDSDGNGFIDDLHGINAIQLTGNPTDDQGHGTHVAGTIGARGNDGVGVTGVAWNVRLMGLKFLSASGGGATSDAILCIEYGVDHGAHILNNSWGGGAFSQALLDAVQAARDAGVLFVVAAGNSASDNDVSPIFPASLPVDNIVAVAATTRTDALSDFSCYGQGAVDLGAPGSDIVSTGYDHDAHYRTMSGTSMAAPHVAGALALLRAQFPEDGWHHLIHRLYRGGDAIPSLANGRVATGRRLNLHGALTSSSNRPLHDDFASARALVGDRIVLRTTLRGATADPGQPAIHGDTTAKTIWFNYTAAAPGLSSVTALTGESLFNPMNGQTLTVPYQTVPVSIAVFTGDSLETLVPLGSDDRTVTFTAQAGATYRIAVAGQDGAEGLLMLGVTGAPRNSTLANATALTVSNSVSGTNRNALSEPGEPAHAGQAATASVWYKWTANFTGRVVFTTRGSDFDTVAAVYSGPAEAPTFASLTPVAANDNENERVTSRVEFQALSGVTYYFAIDGKAAATGSVAAILTIPPGNDYFNEPTILSGREATRTLTTAFASREPGEPIPYPDRGRGESVWFSWTAPESGRTTIDLAGSFFPGLIGVYTGNAVNALTLVTRDGAGNRFAQVTFDAVQGTTYRILVDAWDFSLNNVPLRLRMVPVPPNDTFADATELQGVRATIVSSNVGSTRDPGEPSANYNGGGSVWFKWTAPASGTYGIYGERLNKPEQWSIVLNVFTGSSVNSLTHVKEDLGNGIGRDAFVFWNAIAGQTYHIQVTGLTAGGILGGVGPFSLDLRPRAEHAAPNDNFADALELDPATPIYNLRTHSYGTTAEPGEPAHSSYTASETLWWKFTAPDSARYVFSTALSEGSRGTTVYRTTNPSAPAFSNLVAVANNVATANQLFNEVAFDTTAGTTYFIVTDRMQGARGRHIVHFQKVPANYVFAGRATITGESANIAIQNHGAIREANEPTLGAGAASLGHRSLWWSWTAPSSGIYQLDTIGSETPGSEDGVYPDRTLYGFDTRLGVFTGEALGALSQVAVNDSRTKESYGNSWIDFQRNSRLEFAATAGTTYLFLVNGENLDTFTNPNQTNTGLIRLNLTRLVAPANNDFVNATTITGTDYRVTTTTFGATKEPGEPNHAGQTGGRSLWWKWTAPESGTFVASTAGVIYDDYHARRTAIGVYTGSAVNALTAVASNQNGAGPNTGDDTWSLVQFNAQAGTTYYFGVDANFAGSLSFIFTRPPANDMFVNATVMTGSRWIAHGHNLGASKEAGEPMIEAFFNPPDTNFRSVWWRWTAPVSGSVTVDTLGSQSYNVLAVFTGSAVNTLTPLTEVPTDAGNPYNGDATTRARSGTLRRTFNAVAGTTYSICVQGAGFVVPSSGPIMLSLVGPPAVPFAPVNFTAQRTSATTMELDWDDAAVDEESYEIERSLDGTHWTLLHQTPPDTTFYTDATAVATNGAYQYRIRAVNSVGTSAWVLANATTNAAPAPVTGLTATASGSGNIALSWSDASNDETGFKVQRATDPSAEGNFTTLATVAANVTAFLDTGLPPGAVRYYRIVATNAFGDANASPVAAAITLASAPKLSGSTATWHRGRTGLSPSSAATISGSNVTLSAGGANPANDAQTPHWTHFSPVTLADGDTLRLRGSFRFVAAPPTIGQGFSLGLVNTAGTQLTNNVTGHNPPERRDDGGYGFTYGLGGDTTSRYLHKPAAHNANGPWTTIDNSSNTLALGATVSLSITGTTSREFVFELVREGSALRIRHRDGGSLLDGGRLVSSPETFTYDSVAFVLRRETTSVVLENLVVEHESAAAELPPRIVWRTARFGTAAGYGASADLADPDGDGFVNLLEYALDLDPLAASSPQAIEAALSDSGTHLQLSFFRARAELTYEILGSSDLDTWNVIATNPGAVGQIVNATDTEPISSRRFLRLRVRP